MKKRFAVVILFCAVLLFARWATADPSSLADRRETPVSALARAQADFDIQKCIKSRLDRTGNYHCLNVAVKDGVVTLTGTARKLERDAKPDTVAAATKAAERCGATKVNNLLSVTGEDWRTAKSRQCSPDRCGKDLPQCIEKALEATGHYRCVKVTMNDCVITISGLARPKVKGEKPGQDRKALADRLALECGAQRVKNALTVTAKDWESARGRECQ